MQEQPPAGAVDVPGARVVSVNVSAVHAFSKEPAPEVRLLAGLGVDGDAHCGTTVRHRFDRRRDPGRPNLRQVHVIASELLDDLAAEGHVVRPGELGENVTTRGVDLLALPEGTLLRLGDHASVRLTGLRTPCRLIDAFQPGLMNRLWTGGPDGARSRRAGVMAVVVTGGSVRPGDPLDVVLPAPSHRPLGPV